MNERLVYCLAAGLCLIIAALLVRSLMRIARAKKPPRWTHAEQDGIDWLQETSFKK